MFKILDYAPTTNTGEPSVIVIDKGSRIKVATEGAYAPEIREFIASLKPVKDKLYALINALGAAEFYSCNRNGDAFYEDALKKYHHTFVNEGTPFMHHKNKDPNKGYGKIIKSAYNDKMHRVELIIEYDTRKLDPKYIKKIEDGELVNVSMGCRVDADYCSICGNRATDPANYCEHLKKAPGLGKCLPDGKKAFAINKDPVFFDLSIVTVPADPTARILCKIASSEAESSVARALEEGLKEDLKEPRKARTKEASLLPFIMELTDKIDSFMGPPLSDGLLGALSNRSSSIFELLNGLMRRNIYMRPSEVQTLVLKSCGEDDLADKASKTKVIVMGDPEIGKSLLSRHGASELPNLEELNDREITPDTITKITIRIISEPAESMCSVDKLAGVVNDKGVEIVDFSDDFLYLLDPKYKEERDSAILESKAHGILKSLAIIGALISYVKPEVMPLGLGLRDNARDIVSGLSVFNLLHSPLKDKLDLGIGKLLANSAADETLKAFSADTQEMQFMNPNSPEAIKRSLELAMSKFGSLNESKCLKASWMSSMTGAVLNKIAEMEGPNDDIIEKVANLQKTACDYTKTMILSLGRRPTKAELRESLTNILL